MSLTCSHSSNQSRINQLAVAGLIILSRMELAEVEMHIIETTLELMYKNVNSKAIVNLCHLKSFNPLTSCKIISANLVQSNNLQKRKIVEIKILFPCGFLNIIQ